MIASSGPKSPSKPNSTAERLVREADLALSSEKPKTAARLLKHALKMVPDDAQTQRLMGIACLMAGDDDQAINHLRRALELQPEDVSIHTALGSALVETDSATEGLKYLTHACNLAPDSAVAWGNLGIGHKFQGNMEGAREALEKALAIEPDALAPRINLAKVLQTLGRSNESAKMLRQTIARHPECVDAWVAPGNMQTEVFGAGDIESLKRLLRQANIPDHARVSLGFTLAQALESQGNYREAFNTFAGANRLQRACLHWNPAEEKSRVDAIANAFARPVSGSRDGTLGEGIIFVVCLPRSASTLTEQILASHPQVTGGDEISVLQDLLELESTRCGQEFPRWVAGATQADWQRLGEGYLEQTRSLREQHPGFTDKAPNNWAFVGAALAMLPAARIVNSRRDPLETCLACFRQLFPVGCHFTYDLDELVSYYAGYDRLSRLWQKNYPNHYFDNHYEQLQQDFEGQVRRLLEFCRLPFDRACLNFHQTKRLVHTLSAAQVRQPLRQDTARSARYGNLLDPLRAKLGAAGIDMPAR